MKTKFTPHLSWLERWNITQVGNFPPWKLSLFSLSSVEISSVEIQSSDEFDLLGRISFRTPSFGGMFRAVKLFVPELPNQDYNEFVLLYLFQ